MTGRVQTNRSLVSGNRPTGRQVGELYINLADAQLGVINSGGGTQDLIGVPFFSTLSELCRWKPRRSRWDTSIAP